MIYCAYKTKQFLLALIRLSLVVTIFYLIYSTLFQNVNWSFAEFVQNLINFSSISVTVALILLFLSLFNWIMEIRKRQTLISPIFKMLIIEVKSQSLGTLIASILTTKKSADYGGKTLLQPGLNYVVIAIMPCILIFDLVIKSGAVVYMLVLLGVVEFHIISIVTLSWVLDFIFRTTDGNYLVRLKLLKPIS